MIPGVRGLTTGLGVTTLRQLTVNVKVKNVKLRSALRTMLSPHSLTFGIVGDSVLIGTEDVVLYRQLRQRVSVDADHETFGKAVRELARETGVNVLIDRKVQ